jgi:hypothetical protein
MPADLMAVSSKGWTRSFKRDGETFTLVIAYDLLQSGEERIEDVDTERPYNHECPNFHAFLKDHAEDVLEIKRKLLALRRALQLELAKWLLARDVSGYCFTDLDLNELETTYSSALTGAHIDYGELVYPKKARMCNHCGVLASQQRCHRATFISAFAGSLSFDIDLLGYTFFARADEVFV